MFDVKEMLRNIEKGVTAAAPMGILRAIWARWLMTKHLSSNKFHSLRKGIKVSLKSIIIKLARAMLRYLYNSWMMRNDDSRQHLIQIYHFLWSRKFHNFIFHASTFVVKKFECERKWVRESSLSFIRNVKLKNVVRCQMLHKVLKGLRCVNHQTFQRDVSYEQSQ